MEAGLIFKIVKYRDLFTSRLRMAEKSLEEKIGIEEFEMLVILSNIMIDNLDRITNEQGEEFLSMYELASTIHNPKVPYEIRIETVKKLAKKLNEHLMVYSICKDLNEDALDKELEFKRKQIYALRPSKKQSEGNIQGERELQFRPQNLDKGMPPLKTEEQLRQEEEQRQLNIFLAREIRQASGAKIFIANTLKDVALDIITFQKFYEQISDVRNIRQVRIAPNSILYEQRYKEMQNHLNKLKAYHKTIADLYNFFCDMTREFSENPTEYDLDDLMKFERLAYKLRKVSNNLKVAAGANSDFEPIVNPKDPTSIRIDDFNQRRLRLRGSIAEYNNLVEYYKILRDKNDSGIKLG